MVFGEGIGDGGDLAGIPYAKSASHLTHGVGLGCDVRGYAEIVLASFHGEPEVTVVGCISVDERAIGQDNLPILLVVDGKNHLL